MFDHRRRGRRAGLRRGRGRWLWLLATALWVEPALPCSVARAPDAEDCPERIAESPFALRLRLVRYEVTAKGAVMARLQVLEAYKPGLFIRLRNDPP